jgi:SPP1 gp7 family putative phage head morphogenesis protein
VTGSSELPELKAADKVLAEAEVAHAVVRRAQENAVVAGVLALFEKEVVQPVIEVLSRVESIAVSTPAALRRSKRLQTFADKIEKIASEGNRVLEKRIFAELRDWSKQEIDFLVRTGQTVLTVDLDKPSAALVNELLKDEQVLGRSAKDWVKSVPESTAKNVVRRVKRGLAAGESASQITRAVRGTRAMRGVLDISRRNVQTVMTTLLTHASAQARMATFEENQNVVKKVQFLAVLDGRTTIECAGLDGEIFNVGDRFPKPPLHINCRSTVISYFGPPKGKRAALGGQVDAKTHYEDWLRTQTKEIQDTVLGKTKAAAWRQGKLGIDQMVDASRSRVLTLEELRAVGLL